MKAEEVIKILGLEKHPAEGGYFLETFRSSETVTGEVHQGRSLGTAIYYMLTNETDVFSEMHLLSIDEIFYFHMGDPVEMLHLYPDGHGETVILGTDLKAGMRPQVFIPRGVWQGARLVPGGSFALMGTTTTPGFEYEDYRSGSQKELTQAYPEYKELVSLLTRKP